MAVVPKCKQNYRVNPNKDENRDEKLKIRNSSPSEKRKMVDEKVQKVKKVNMDLALRESKSRHTESRVDILEVNEGVEGLDSSKALRQIADFVSFIRISPAD